ncbi:5-formyltetrahydrofolate cyclo-ligase [Thermosphaera chiliense]|uniref:5-formyltetrahydrofolate cyclo-ligase n=1 Tax=Thermosphaera chiliense TaxID=3402707 RepID=A0A7M1UTL4_9CREN|nr:5-formyltetrahydrofolate cyclo-ligase [Thermosphaera aggregans]QOR94923.1 5-formyltetrahydrofolate cyclo-ligase [Thermosphaera aggregans]
MTLNIKAQKQLIRERIWRLLEEKNVALFPRPVYGRIPNFAGAERAAQRLLSLKVWENAEVVKSNPDSPQAHLREHALRQGKTLVMATPRLLNGFLVLKPSSIEPSRIRQATTIKGAFKHGRRVSLREIPPVDLVVTGCVAVDLKGRRLGKGGGYSELEYAILRELHLLDEKTPILTTIHDLQIVDEVPLEPHDYTVDYVATPAKLIRIDGEMVRPKGIFWELLGDKENLEVVRELKSILSK